MLKNYSNKWELQVSVNKSYEQASLDENLKSLSHIWLFQKTLSILQKAYIFVYDTFSTYQLLVLSGEMAFPCVFENTVTIFFS